jgi:tRNA(fMet)-specific endonuclease VapC
MENRKILVDTCVIIDYLRSSNKVETLFIKLLNRYDLCISVISIFELYNGGTSEKKRSDIDTLRKEMEIIDLNYDMAKLASTIYLDLKQKNKLIEFRDILIGAVALDLEIELATLNHKHFTRINNLTLHPFK